MGAIKEFIRFSFRETLNFIIMEYNVVYEKNDLNFFFVPFFPSFVMDVTVCEDHHLAITHLLITKCNQEILALVDDL